MNEFVLIDASVAIKRLVEEENFDTATLLTRLWDDEDTPLAASHLMPFQIANTLPRRVVRTEPAEEVTPDLMQHPMSLGLQLPQGPIRLPRARSTMPTICPYLRIPARSAGSSPELPKSRRPGADNLHWIGEFFCHDSYCICQSQKGRP